MVVTDRLRRRRRRPETFLLGSREEGAHGSLQVYSPQSPLGAAILGASRGESREYPLPNGRAQKVERLDGRGALHAG